MNPVALAIVTPWQLELPVDLARSSRHQASSSLETWSTRTMQVTVRVHRDSIPRGALRFGANACAIGELSVDRPSFRPRIAGGDSIHGLRTAIVIDDTTILELQVAAMGRSGLDSLAAVLTSLRRMP